MIATPAGAVIDVALDEGGATELSAPDDEGVVEQAALFQIHDERGARLVGISALGVEFGGQRVVLIPSGVHKLHAAGAAFDEATGHETVVREASGLFNSGAVAFEDRGGFVGEIRQLRHTALHAEGHFILGDACGDFRIVEILELLFVDAGYVIKHAAFHVARDAFGIGKVEDGVAAGAKFHALVSGWKEAGSPVEFIKDLSAGGSLADGGEDDKRGEVFCFTSQSVAQPRAEGWASGKLGSAEQKGDGRCVVHSIGMHGFDKA